MRDGTRAFFQIQGFFNYFRAFKTKILHIYSLTGQLLKQLSPSVWVTSVSMYPTSESCFSRAVIGSLISEYPGYSLISDRDRARDCFLMIWLFFKRPVSY